MKFFFLIISSFLTLNINANEINNSNYPFIKPISVENAQKAEKSYFGDTDKDGVSDDKDNCQNTALGADVDIFGCIILDDLDKDGIPNADDKCPNSSDGATVNLEGCEPDNDEDGVPDSIDTCPYTTQDFTVDKKGCPQSAILNLKFKNENNEFTQESIQKLDEFVEFLKENNSYQVIIYSFTDNYNSTKINKKVSKNRADAVMDTLMSLGIKLTRLTAIGMGSKAPIADNNTPEGREKNNRIEVELLK